MVVGGGIAGMQASLDLADQGFKVYLVETKSAIGGKMAQLDKTFPTNDCAMCTISPKLVESGNHPNIEILTRTDVVGLTGQPGSFKVQLQHRPRYVDPLKCVACDDCAEACPVVIPDQFNEGLSSRKAAFKLYPQAVPNAYAIEKRGIAPCRDACPAGQRAQGYIALIREGRWHDALRVIKMDNPFPGICGRICNHRCEDACNRTLVDEAVNIRALKRFVTDKVYSEPREPVEPAIRSSNQQVAIIGAGPCGLTAAQDLLMAGYGATIFEAMPVAGGMLRLGVPEYRLPTEIIEREVQDIVDLGLDLRLNQQVDNLNDLFDEGFDAVVVAVGAHEGIRLPIPGADLDGVLINTHFLRDVRLGRYEDGSTEAVGDTVLVLGGGNVAIDCARSAVRMGKEVHLACLESRAEMPAHDYEIVAAEEEGVHIHPGRTFERVIGQPGDETSGRVSGVECQEVSSFSFDEQGRLILDAVPDSNHVLTCDTVIFSVGQRAGLAFLPDDGGVDLTERNTIAIDPVTLASSREGLFAAGDTVSGTAFVIEAVNSGHKVAESIVRYLQNKPLTPVERPALPVVHLDDDEIAERLASGQVKRQPRVPLPELSIDQRKVGFAEVEGGYDDEAAQLEAARCLSCGICSECMSCVFACGAKAINHDEVATESIIDVGALVLAPGYQIYNAQLSEEFGLGRYPNVVTSLQYERLLSASGPTGGHVQRPSDGTSPRRIAFLQCVGSRDQDHDYCSSVCCMYAAKEAIMTIEHARAEARSDDDGQETTCKIFFMDTRAYSKGYEEYYQRAEQKYGVEYARCRLSDVKQDPSTGNLVVRHTTPFANSNDLIEEEFDLVVLSVGMEISDSVKELSQKLGVELDHNGFCKTSRFDPLQTSREGIYVAGPFREPKDIPETVIEASGAAAAVATILATARNSLTTIQSYPNERDVSAEELRTGVFVCHCGSNIGGFLDVPGVAEFARGLPGVVHSEDRLYTCSQDSIAHIIEQTIDLNLNRVVVASCTPLTHEPLFQDAIRQAGLNPHLFEMANIRNQCSWVHSDDFAGATVKAKVLVRMAVARASNLAPLKSREVPVNKTALVIGGGPAGMTAALNLADQGFPVHLVEKSGQLGGNLRNLSYFIPNGDEDSAVTPTSYLNDLIGRVEQHHLIETHLLTELTETGGFRGNFTSTLRHDAGSSTLKHGAVIVATGGVEYRGNDYHYGEHPNILTQMEFESRLAGSERRIGQDSPELFTESSAGQPGSVVMIQCVGPGERYCSRICCTTALKNALKLRQLAPESDVTVIYRDIRTYGFKERLYTEARAAGVRFVHYSPDRKPEVEIIESSSALAEQRLRIRLWDPTLGRHLELTPDLVVLSMPVIPPEGNERLANVLKLPSDMDGFFREAHVKLRPVDFSVDGVFMAGMAHYPKFLDETIAQAQAAASRAATVLAQDTTLTNARVAVVDPLQCVACLTCVRICPYGVPQVDRALIGVGEIGGAAFIEPAICQGCGSCVSECPARAIELMHYTDAQTLRKIDALVGATSPAGFVALENVDVV